MCSVFDRRNKGLKILERCFVFEYLSNCTSFKVKKTIFFSKTKMCFYTSFRNEKTCVAGVA